MEISQFMERIASQSALAFVFGVLLAAAYTFLQKRILRREKESLEEQLRMRIAEYAHESLRLHDETQKQSEELRVLRAENAALKDVGKQLEAVKAERAKLETRIAKALEFAEQSQKHIDVIGETVRRLAAGMPKSEEKGTTEKGTQE